MSHSFHKNSISNVFNITMIIIRNVTCTANQHIGLISEGSCDTEDWILTVEN